MATTADTEREARMGVTMIYPTELIERIDVWRYDNRFPTRSDAIRWLLDYAMRTHPELSPEEASERRSMVTKAR